MTNKNINWFTLIRRKDPSLIGTKESTLIGTKESTLIGTKESTLIGTKGFTLIRRKGPSLIQRKGFSLIRRKGFTLIELLVTVSIISILATFLMANFIGIRQRGRDAQRKSDVRQLQSALELWRSDNGIYPATIASCGNALTTGGVTYMQKIPCDPLGTGSYNSGNYYYPASDGLTYTIAACLENIKDSQGTSTSPGGSGCTTSFYYVLQNP